MRPLSRIAAIIFILAPSLLVSVAGASVNIVTVCDEAHFNTAFGQSLNRGTVTFALDCNLTITSTKIIDTGQVITIDGAGHKVTISGGGSVQIFFLFSGGELTLHDLTLANGLATPPNSGGAIESSSGSVTLKAVTLAGNKTVGASGAKGADCSGGCTAGRGTDGGAGQGGAIANLGGDLTITNSTFTGNIAQGGTGGAGGNGTNFAIGGNGGTGGQAQGGAIFSSSTTFVALQITDSTFSGNQAIGGVGGHGGSGRELFNTNGGGAGGNGGSAAGGAFFANDFNMQDTTVASSQASGGIGGPGGDGGCFPPCSGPPGANGSGAGGGLADGSVSSNLSNNILAGNSGGNCSLPALSSDIHNLSSDSTCNFNSTGLNKTDPMLAALADNGGPTQTMALLRGSPAIDRGDPATCSPRDQRNFVRVGVCDIGAFELGRFPPHRLHPRNPFPPGTAIAP